MEKRPNSVLVIPCSLDGSFFKLWFSFLRPFHKLTDREIDVIASFVKQRYELSKDIKNQEILDKVVMSDDTKRKVREECNITQSHFQVVMTKLRKTKVIDNGRINPKFIPKIIEGSNSFQLLLSFDLK